MRLMVALPTCHTRACAAAPDSLMSAVANGAWACADCAAPSAATCTRLRAIEVQQLPAQMHAAHLRRVALLGGDVEEQLAQRRHRPPAQLLVAVGHRLRERLHDACV